MKTITVLLEVRLKNDKEQKFKTLETMIVQLSGREAISISMDRAGPVEQMQAFTSWIMEPTSTYISDIKCINHSINDVHLTLSAFQ